jgi:hypothetical protein
MSEHEPASSGTAGGDDLADLDVAEEDAESVAGGFKEATGFDSDSEVTERK